MELKAVYQFMQSLESQLKEVEIETTILEGTRGAQTGDTLRALMGVTDEGHPVIVEFLITEFAEDYDLLHIYTTLLANMNEKAAELPDKLSDWNMECPLGAYGIFTEEGQLFHNYSMPFPPDTDPEGLAAMAMELLGMIHAILSQKYPELQQYAKE